MCTVVNVKCQGVKFSQNFSAAGPLRVYHFVNFHFINHLIFNFSTCSMINFHLINYSGSQLVEEFNTVTKLYRHKSSTSACTVIDLRH
jgi:hypothetical protein